MVVGPRVARSTFRGICRTWGGPQRVAQVIMIVTTRCITSRGRHPRRDRRVCLGATPTTCSPRVSVAGLSKGGLRRTYEKSSGSRFRPRAPGSSSTGKRADDGSKLSASIVRMAAGTLQATHCCSEPLDAVPQAILTRAGEVRTFLSQESVRGVLCCYSLEATSKTVPRICKPEQPSVRLARINLFLCSHRGQMRGPRTPRRQDTASVPSS